MPECINLISDDEQTQPTSSKQINSVTNQTQIKQSITKPTHIDQYEMNQSLYLSENEILIALDKYEKGLPTIQITTPSPRKTAPVFLHYYYMYILYIILIRIYFLYLSPLLKLRKKNSFLKVVKLINYYQTTTHRL